LLFFERISSGNFSAAANCFSALLSSFKSSQVKSRNVFISLQKSAREVHKWIDKKYIYI
jgi:hypothetical protein